MDQPRVERRLSAIVAADVVGYSHLIEIDEAATIAAVNALREEVIAPLARAHNGRMVNSVGDGILIEFGSAVDAVACAVALQQELSDPGQDASPSRMLVLRIGVNLGDVIADGDVVLGDAVKIAEGLGHISEPGGILISGTAHDHVQGKLGPPLDFAGEQHVKTIDRPVRSYRVRLDGVPEAPPRKFAAPHWLAPAAAVLVVAAGVGAYYLWPSARLSGVAGGAKASIAVLPFDNLSGDGVSERLADGLTEEITTDLARYPELDVIARRSVEAHASEPDIRQIGKALDVRYVLEAAIQRDGNRMHVSAQLIDASSGASLWSERWDRPAADIFAVEAEISKQTLDALAAAEPSLTGKTTEGGRQRPADLQTYDLTMLAQESLQKSTEADALAGIEYADRAIARDPDFSRAYVQKAWLTQELSKYRRDWNESSAEMEELARTAIRLDPNDANAHILLAWTLDALGKSAEAVAEAERALELSPSSADILNMAADGMAFLGRPEEGAALCDRSLRLNPTPPDWYYSDCVANFFFAGRYEAAVAAADRGAASTEASPAMLVLKAASEAALDRADAAATTVKALEGTYSEVSLEWLLNTGWSFERSEEQDMILEASRKAGLRLCATENELAEFSSPRRLEECEAQTSG